MSFASLPASSILLPVFFAPDLTFLPASSKSSFASDIAVVVYMMLYYIKWFCYEDANAAGLTANQNRLLILYSLGGILFSMSWQKYNLQYI